MTSDKITIRLARDSDFDTLWPILRDVIRAGDTYALDSQLSREAVFDVWMATPRAAYVAEGPEGLLGTYFIKTNQQGGGAHVCNCGYMVASAAQGQGIARAMCRHSQEAARALGYLAMQFNCVVATNYGAIGLWHSEGFETIGTLPGAFLHPEHGYVDAHVMFKSLIQTP